MTAENQNLQKLPIKDLAKKVICDGHLFLSTAGGRKFYLMKPGVLLDPGFVKKHAPANSIFDFESVVHDEVKKKFKELFKELRYLQFEKDLRMKCLEIVAFFHRTYSGTEHFLSFALACHEEFCLLPFEEQLKMHETDLHLYRKALYSSAFAIIVGMSNDFYHFSMLRDFYNLTMTLDFGLCESNYSYYVAEACNEENRKPGSGQEYLVKEKASKLEVDVFLKHPERSYQFLKKLSVLSFPELAEVALYQHELADGSGFPRGVMKGQVSSWEAIVILADSLVEITDRFTFETEVVNYLLSFQNKKLSDLPVGRVYKKLCHAFNYFESMKETGT